MTQIPLTKAARQQRIVDLLMHRQISSQPQLAAALSDDGVIVTQATLSRDLVDLNAVKVRSASGSLVYAVPGEGGDRSAQPAPESAASEARLAKLCAELLVSAEGSANIVILRTPPGAAQFLASAIDKAELSGTLGTIAGDDTVMVISREAKGGERLAARFLDLANQHASTSTSASTSNANSTNPTNTAWKETK